jgi:DNA-binding protein HU-beta
MNTSELIDEVAERAVLTKTSVKRMVDSLLDVLTAELAAGNDVQLHGFGTLHRTERNAYLGHNPQTGQPLNVAAKRSVKLKMGRALKDAMNPPRQAQRRRA